MNEALNGLDEVEVVFWKKGWQRGVYVKGQPNFRGLTILRRWLDDLSTWRPELAPFNSWDR